MYSVELFLALFTAQCIELSPCSRPRLQRASWRKWSSTSAASAARISASVLAMRAASFSCFFSAASSFSGTAEVLASGSRKFQTLLTGFKNEIFSPSSIRWRRVEGGHFASLQQQEKCTVKLWLKATEPSVVRICQFRQPKPGFLFFFSTSRTPTLMVLPCLVACHQAE